MPLIHRVDDQDADRADHALATMSSSEFRIAQPRSRRVSRAPRDHLGCGGDPGDSGHRIHDLRH